MKRPHSYIYARRFKPKELADYLLKLDTNDTLYKEYFRWKQHYIVEAGMAQMARYGFCHLCHKLHTDDGLKLYHNISEYFGLNTCKHLPNKKMIQMFRELGLSFLKSILWIKKKSLKIYFLHTNCIEKSQMWKWEI